jgi:hypothetical protein
VFQNFRTKTHRTKIGDRGLFKTPHKWDVYNLNGGQPSARSVENQFSKQNCRKSVKKQENSRYSDKKKSGLHVSNKHKFVHVGTQGSGEQFALLAGDPTRTSTTVGTVGCARTCTDYRYQKKMGKQPI